ncbi:hypothetical protein M0813_07172 [Anaeramoeba flamelloides]|uniref:Uncharacterized protein n=1 Tax=Anaeramoeba flamelloides TaxID=1746091 RepID=A0AAV7YF81_9EUKA|nr:hypothetical protein M0812_26138 [Anaeramoeba flamelloides]KAJ6229951.1 hypothetical protein M0813_07172 [Anaeramoeba flamelloides]
MGIFSSCLKSKNSQKEHTQFQNVDVECNDLIETNDDSDLENDEQRGGTVGVGVKAKYGEEIFDSSLESDLQSYSENQEKENDQKQNENNPFTENEPSSDSVLPKESDEKQEKDGYSYESENDDI